MTAAILQRFTNIRRGEAAPAEVRKIAATLKQVRPSRCERGRKVALG